MSKWLEINRGLEADGSDVPIQVLQRTYHTVRSGFIPQLTIRVSAAKLNAGTSNPDSKRIKGSLLAKYASMESWAWIPALDNGGTGGTKCTQILGMFSETHMADSRVRKSDGYSAASGPGRPVLS